MGKGLMMTKVAKILTVVAALAVLGVAAGGRGNGLMERQKRLFSIFNTVFFPNSPCTGTDGSAGICLTRAECESQGGSSVGNCAMGFGTCCRITLTDCGSTVRCNCTIIQNSGFPSPTTSSGSCKYCIERPSSDICFIRLDFERLEVANVADTGANTGDCETDQVTFTQGNGYPVPTMCGTLTDQHLYLDAGPEDGATDTCINHQFSGTATDRYYQYKVSFIKCGTPTTPDRGCLQYYFGGESGTVESYNFQGQYHLNSQYYTVCVRQERGFCKIEYTAADEPFSFKTVRPQGTETAATGPNCQVDYIVIPKGRHKSSPIGAATCSAPTLPDYPYSERYCGGTLSCINNDLVPRTIVSEAGPPFNIYVNFNDEEANFPADNYGFKLNYVQTPC